jgi:hypothetical protein
MKESPKPGAAKPTNISRREFARRAALSSAIAAVAPAVIATSATPSNVHANVAAAHPPEHLSDPSSAPVAPQQPPDLPKLSPESHAEAEARIQTILTQYGGRFNDAQKSDLRRLCFLAQPPLDRLRAYTLENGDAPALYLKPLVEREKNPLENTRVGKTPVAAAKP